MLVRIKQLRFLVTGDVWQKRTAVGILLMFLGTAFFPIWWFVDGYALQLMRKAQQGETLELPKWERWGKLFREGVYINIIRLVYGLPLVAAGLILVLLAVLGMLGTLRAVGPDGRFAEPFFMLGSSFTVIVLGSIFAVPISLFISYITPLGALRYAESRRLDDAFRILRIFKMMGQAPVAYTIAFVVARALLITGVIVGGLSSTTGIFAVIGFVIIGVFGYFADVLTFTVYGLAYRHARERKATQEEDNNTEAVILLEDSPIFKN